VENTDSSSVIIDFPRYLQRLRHVSTRLCHLLQFAKLASEVQADAVKLQENVHYYVQSMIVQLDSFQKNQLPGEHPTTAVFLPTAQLLPASDFHSVDSQVPTHLTVPNPAAVSCLPPQPQSLPSTHLISPLPNYDSNSRGTIYILRSCQTPCKECLRVLMSRTDLTYSTLLSSSEP
jgi:hypothetical protein